MPLLQAARKLLEEKLTEVASMKAELARASEEAELEEADEGVSTQDIRPTSSDSHSEMLSCLSCKEPFGGRCMCNSLLQLGTGGKVEAMPIKSLPKCTMVDRGRR